MSHPSFLKIVPTPQEEFFTGMPPELIELARALLGTIPTPADQPRLSKVIHSLSSSLVEFSRQHTFYAELNWAQIDLATRLMEFSRLRAEMDETPLVHMEGRHSEFVEWTLCLALLPSQTEISAPLGAEIALALEEGRTLQRTYLTHLKRDLKKVPRTAHRGPKTERDLQQMGVGQKWRPGYAGKVKRLALLAARARGRKSADDTSLSEAGVEHLSHIRGKAFNTTAKQRTGVRNRQQVTRSQFADYCADLRERLDLGTTGALNESMSLLTGLGARGVMNLPLDKSVLPGEVLTLDLDRGGLHVDLRHLIPRRKLKLAATAQYLLVEDSYFVPWPTEVVAPLQALALKYSREGHHPAAVLRIVDILPQSERDHETTPGVSVLQDDTQGNPGFTLTVARARKTLPTQALDSGVPRVQTAYACLDLSRVGRARPWYSRIDSADFDLRWRAFLSSQGWTVSPQTDRTAGAFGSPYVLTDPALTEIWSFHATRVQSLPNAPRMGLQACIALHNAYMDQVAMVMSFLLALRESTEYELFADQFLGGTELVGIDDKHDPSKPGSRFLVIGAFVRLTVGNWFSHCEALLQRYLRDPQAGKTKIGSQVIAHLQAVVSGRHVALLFWIAPNGVRPASSARTWGKLPPLLACEANVGRHYWATYLQDTGCSDAALDLFMRHMSSGMTPTNAYEPRPISVLAREVITLQEGKLRQLQFSVPVGLRKAP